MDNIIFKGHKNKLTVLLNKNENFERLKNDFVKKIQSSKKFFSGAKKTHIEFKGCRLTQNQKSELMNIILNETGLDISTFKQNENSSGKNNMPEEIKSIIQKNSLRSGQFIHYKGNVIVLGDVNPGAEIIAAGNIIVMGTIKGLVHAGCEGNKKCLITALSLLPVQLRIADIITRLPDNEIVTKPSYAYINDDKLYISPLQ